MLRQSKPQHEFFQWFSGYYNMSPTVFDLIEKSFLRKCIPFFLIPVDKRFSQSINDKFNFSYHPRSLVEIINP